MVYPSNTSKRWDQDDDVNPQKAEYSLNQHLANNLIDLYINLPSKNRYRRPASYLSKGYRSRRMAVDFAVPLITNVKCAKLFIEAIIRKPTFDITTVDYKTSHETYTFPSLISLGTFVPGAADSGSSDFVEATKAAIRGGFTTIQMLPQGTTSILTDEISLQRAQSNAAGQAHCDYFFAVAAVPDNASRLADALAAGAKVLYIPFSRDSGNKATAVSEHFAAWPEDRPIVTDAEGADLASVLLLANLHGRSIHVASVSTLGDIQLISMAKAKGMSVTCDVAVYSLFFSKQDYDLPCLPSALDQAALWDNLASIDAFTVGSVPFELGTALGQPVSSSSGLEECLPLLLTAVADGRLTLEDISLRLNENPRNIFGLPEQTQTYVEVEVNRHSTFQSASWSPLNGKLVAGTVHRVVLNGQSVHLDGSTFSTPVGRDVAPGATTRTVRTSMPIQRARSPLLERPSSTFQPLALHQPPNFMSLSSLAPREPSPPRGLSTLTLSPHPAFSRRHILSVKQFNRDDLHALFNLASEMRTQVERTGTVDTLRGRVLCTLFYEPSTRTSTSFEAAMKRCGGEVVHVTSDSSSVVKGESLADTIRTVGCYADAIALRHPSVGSSKSAAKISPVPILNAGDGPGEHPTQSLLDVYTIREELGSVNGITLTLGKVKD